MAMSDQNETVPPKRPKVDRTALVKPGEISAADRERFMKGAHDPVIKPVAPTTPEEPPVASAPPPAGPAETTDPPANQEVKSNPKKFLPRAVGDRRADRRAKPPTRPPATPREKPAAATGGKKKNEPKAVAGQPQPTPWAGAHPKVRNNVQLRTPDELHMKVKWLADNTLPKRSMHDILLDAVEEHVEAQLAIHYYGKGKGKS
jgi:hypothetical protein